MDRCLWEEEQRLRNLEREEDLPLHHSRENLRQRHSCAQPGSGLEYSEVRNSVTEAIHSGLSDVIDGFLSFWRERFGEGHWWKEGAFSSKACDTVLDGFDVQWPSLQRPTREGVAQPILVLGDSSYGKGRSPLVNFRRGGVMATYMVLPITSSLSGPVDSDPPMAFQLARLVPP